MTKIYPCGGTYIYIDVPSEEALPTCHRYALASLAQRWFELSSFHIVSTYDRNFSQ